MAVILEGQGTTFTMAGFTTTPKTITFPGWEKQEIDITNLSNSAWKTKVLAALKESSKLILNCETDMSVFAAIPEGNISLVVTFAGTAENITIWVDPSVLGDVTFNTDEQPIYDLELTVTNLNASGVETGPVYSAT